MPAISELRRADDDHRAVFLRAIADDMGERIRRRGHTAIFMMSL